MSWWMWVLLGLALLGIEILTPGGFFVLFFGVAALVVGVLVAFDAGGPLWLQWVVFSVVSVVSLLVLRSRLTSTFRGSEGGTVGIDRLVGEVATLTTDLDPGAIGKAELRGTVWSVRGTEAQRLPRGRRCRVERVEGLVLWVKAE
jgi:membrane protein implicated in regulation of membrane protease activity